jgi:hypothetical protein
VWSAFASYGNIHQKKKWDLVSWHTLIILTSTAKLKIFGTSLPLVLNIYRHTFAAAVSLGGFFHPVHVTQCIELLWNDGSDSLYASLL